ncbi:right-handed parallel beta-helix repeat-containing protein [Geomonas sp. RF6]|uniref:right-handed parallel beta-helix repeat-containing protein n=1 Tax=Geomonas sp. RF6 TaxID=2897342 RepID=UPI001E56AE13|nr:right-handed parallel beta-helix repeat-containing protein [Geomonas sp. RF6]UFS69350.1 right-handed parallel beta-helix repeat-containing protein [Geomonas sp. RF6]
MWREMLSVSSSGVSGAPITYSAYGSGEPPVFNGANHVTGWTAHSGQIYRKSYAAAPGMVWFNGDFGTRVSSLASLSGANRWYWSAGVLYVYSATDPDGASIEAQARGASVYTNGKSYVTFDGLKGIHSPLAFDLEAGTGLTVQNCVADEVGTAMATFTTPYVVFQKNVITRCHFLPGGVDGGGIALSVGDNAHATIANNSISYTDAYGIGIVLDNVTGGSVYGNVIHHTGQNLAALENYGIDVWGKNFDVSQNEIYSHGRKAGDHALYIANLNNSASYNYIHDNFEMGISVETTSAAGKTNLAYNIVSGNGSDGIRLQGYSGANVYNNVLYGNNRTDGLAQLTCVAATPVVIRNNVFARGATGELRINEAAASATLSNNLYYHPAGGAFLYWKADYYAWANWGSVSGERNAYYGDPLFAVPGSDFHPLQGSPLLGRGIYVGLSKDFDGNPVPGTPAIGAYEYQTEPSPPTNLRFMQ